MQITVNALLSFDREITTLQHKSVLAILLQGRIKEFYNKCSLRIIKAKEDIGNLNAQYYIYEEGSVKVEGEKKTPVMQEGKTEQEYNEKLAAILNQTVTVDL